MKEFTITEYAIRVEYPNGMHEDLKMSASTLKDARASTERHIELLTGDQHVYDWRGQVVFVDVIP